MLITTEHNCTKEEHFDTKFFIWFHFSFQICLGILATHTDGWKELINQKKRKDDAKQRLVFSDFQIPDSGQSVCLAKYKAKTCARKWRRPVTLFLHHWHHYTRSVISRSGNLTLNGDPRVGKLKFNLKMSNSHGYNFATVCKKEEFKTQPFSLYPCNRLVGKDHKTWTQGHRTLFQNRLQGPLIWIRSMDPLFSYH